MKCVDPIKCCSGGGAPEAAEERRADRHHRGSSIQLKLRGEAGGANGQARRRAAQSSMFQRRLNR